MVDTRRSGLKPEGKSGPRDPPAQPPKCPECTSQRVWKDGLRKTRTGSIVYVRYYDHVLFRDVNPELYKPFIREAIGWLDYEDDHYIRLVWERYSEPRAEEESKPKATGLIILKEAIMEMRRITRC